MVNSIHTQIRYFCDYFSRYQQSYVLIGGAACATWYKDYTPGFRTTRDLDIVLILEQLHPDFVEHFLQFVNQSGYKQWEKYTPSGEAKKVMYRFISPAETNAPEQLELLSRKGNIPSLDESCTVAPVKSKDEYTGLSCIVLDDDYYHFLTQHVNRVNNLSLLSVPALIMLKIRAYHSHLELAGFGRFGSTPPPPLIKKILIQQGESLHSSCSGSFFAKRRSSTINFNLSGWW